MNKLLNLVVLGIVYMTKRLNFPRFFKFYLFQALRGKKLMASGRLKKSGLLMNLDIGNFVEYMIYMYGEHDEEWIKKIINYVRGKTFVDIGANVGIYSLSFFKDAKKIYAFEPESRNYSRFLGNIKLNSISNIEVIRKAVSSSNRKSKLFIDKVDQGRHSLISAGEDFVEVSSTTLDSFVQKNNIRNIGLIKVDAEGAEMKVLQGALKTMRKYHTPMLVEVNSPTLGISASYPEEIFSFMEKLGYSGYALIGGRLKKISAKHFEGVVSENILFKK